MKKTYVFTESQAKKVIDNLISEQIKKPVVKKPTKKVK